MKIQKRKKRKVKYKDKYENFADFILNEPFVFKFLIVTAKYFGAVVFTLFAWLLLSYGVTEIGVIISVMAVAGWWGVIKFHRQGGWHNMPDLTSSQALWNRDKIKFKKSKKKK